MKISLYIFMHVLKNLFVFIAFSLYCKIAIFNMYPVSIPVNIHETFISHRIWWSSIIVSPYFIYLGKVGIDVSPFIVVQYSMKPEIFCNLHRFVSSTHPQKYILECPSHYITHLTTVFGVLELRNYSVFFNEWQSMV